MPDGRILRHGCIFMPVSLHRFALQPKENTLRIGGVDVSSYLLQFFAVDGTLHLFPVTMHGSIVNMQL